MAFQQVHAASASEIQSNLWQSKILDANSEQRLERIAELVSMTLNADRVLISLVDNCNQWSSLSLNFNDAAEVPLTLPFCEFTLKAAPSHTLVSDTTRDLRFQHEALVTGSAKVKAYAGVALHTPDGQALGTLGVFHSRARSFSDTYFNCLERFSTMVIEEVLADPQPDLNSSESSDQDSRASIGTKPTSFEACMAVKCHRNVIAATIALPNVDALARAYGNTIVDGIVEETQRRILASLDGHTLHLVQVSRGRFTLIVAINRLGMVRALDFLQDRLTTSLTPYTETMGVSVLTPIRIGLSRPATGDCSAEQLIRFSEIAYEHIDTSRAVSGFKVYDDQMGERVGRYQKISSDIGGAINDDKLEIHFQPKVAVESNHVESVEALVRWQHPELGSVSPPEMLSVLEDLQMAPELDFWVLRTACKQLRAWESEGLRRVPISINICGSTLMEPDFPEKASKIVEEHSIPIDLIELEILESVVIHDIEHAFGQLQRCRDLGFKIALDDFGAGQTSLKYLTRLPVDTVKIDRSFVDEIVQDTRASDLIARIIAMCKSQGMTTVVEGVETVGQYLLLRSFACDFIQGFYFSKPEPATTASQWMSSPGQRLEPVGLEAM